MCVFVVTFQRFLASLSSTLICVSPQMRPFNLLGHKTLRDLDPSDIDKLICVEGMVTRTSTVIPDLR